MARRAWAGSLLLALIISAGAASVQLALASFLGVIGWLNRDGSPGRPDHPTWTAGLVWLAWAMAVSVVLGAIAGQRRWRDVPGRAAPRILLRLLIVVVATIGALVALPLVLYFGREIEMPDNYAPYLLAGVYAVAGAGLGLIVSLFAVTARAVAANVLAVSGWLWVLAGIVVVEHLANDTTGYADLATWEFTVGGPFWRGIYIPGALLMIGAALLIGGLAAFPAAGRGDRRFGVAISGAIGPLLVAAAYGLA
ncbi:MAG TPA: hypothetical protein VF163_03575, partial [Micromonosporaceae bacterium]